MIARRAHYVRARLQSLSRVAGRPGVRSQDPACVAGRPGVRSQDPACVATRPIALDAKPSVRGHKTQHTWSQNSAHVVAKLNFWGTAAGVHGELAIPGPSRLFWATSFMWCRQQAGFASKTLPTTTLGLAKSKPHRVSRPLAIKRSPQNMREGLGLPGRRIPGRPPVLVACGLPSLSRSPQNMRGKPGERCSPAQGAGEKSRGVKKGSRRSPRSCNGGM